MPSRSALVTMASGKSPVSNRTEVVVPPVRTLTSAEKPCSAIRPTWVVPHSNCGCLRGTGCEESSADPLPPAQESVVDVVHQGGHHDLVYRLERDGADSTFKGRVRRGGAYGLDSGRLFTHADAPWWRGQRPR